MVLNVQVNNLDGKVRTKGAYPFSHCQHTDIWEGEYINGEPPLLAIKILRPYHESADASTAKVLVAKLKNKLFREAEVWTMLNHPNIVPFLGVTTTAIPNIGPIPGLVTHYYKNGCLKRYLSNDKLDLSLNDKMNLLSQIADALDYLHGQKPAVIHGDIKPENVLIDDCGRAVVADFGLAVLLGAAGFTTKDVHGTLHYIAPEMMGQRDTSQDGPVRPSLATDVWAFGITATGIFSKRTPYGSSKDAVVLNTVVTNRDKLRREDYPEIRMSLWTGLVQCWEWEPNKRVTMHTLSGFIKTKRDSYAQRGITG